MSALSGAVDLNIGSGPLTMETKSAETRPMLRPQMRRVAIWSSLALVCLGVVTSLLLLRGFERQLEDVTKTFAVRTSASQLSQSLVEAEANQRGYLLTGDEQFYQAYQSAIAGISDDADTLLTMTEDDRAQHARLEGITGSFVGKLAEMQRVVELARLNEGGQALNLLETGLGARLMSEVTQTLADFVAEEDEKLAQRNEAIRQTRSLSAFAMIAAVFASVVLAYSLLARTQRQVSLLAMERHGLKSQNELLESEVAERTKVIEEAKTLAEKERERVETLLQDMNHRIGNSLATVSSLLALQAMRSNSDKVKTALEAARQRVHAIASAHRRLRLGDDLETTSAAEFLGAVVEDIADTQADSGRVSISADIEPIEVGARDATTLGILVGELITNALKHAFPNGQGGAIIVKLYKGDDGIAVLDVEDNGAGLQNETSDEGLGSVIVKQLSNQFGGEPKYIRRDTGGLTVRITMPQLGQLLHGHEA